MIIKKPYAFLIKHFRLVHGLLFGLLLFLTLKTINIYTFFSGYVSNHTYLNQTGLASLYVTIPMFLLAILAALITFVIYYILSVKNKSDKVYLFIILDCILLFIFFIYMYNVFTGLESKSLETESVRVLRDISLLVVFPQIILLFITFSRTLGFNIKQFDFKKDLEELEIDVSDSEEVEVTFGLDTYKVMRFIRKSLRLTKYFMLENKIFVITMASLLILGVSIYSFSTLSKYQESYEQAENLEISSLTFNVKNSYITNVDMSNNIINNSKHYVLVDIYVKNKYSSEYALTRETFSLVINNQMILPTFSVKEQFKDIGEVFAPVELKALEEKNYIIVFEIDSENIEKDYMFKIKNNNNSGLANDYYKNVIIKPINLNNNKDIGNYKVPSEIKLDDSMFKNSIVKIDELSIDSKFKEKYKYSLNGKEYNGIYSIIPSTSDKTSLDILRIKGSIKLDNSVYFSRYIKTPSDFFEYYGIIRYRYLGEYKTTKLKKINVNYETNNYSYLEIPKEVRYSNKADLIILIRGIKYTINLK